MLGTIGSELVGHLAAATPTWWPSLKEKTDQPGLLTCWVNARTRTWARMISRSVVFFHNLRHDVNCSICRSTSKLIVTISTSVSPSMDGTSRVSPDTGARVALTRGEARPRTIIRWAQPSTPSSGAHHLPRLQCLKNAANIKVG